MDPVVVQAPSIPGAVTQPEIGQYFDNQEAAERTAQANPATTERKDNQVGAPPKVAPNAADPAKEASDRKSLDKILDGWESGHPDVDPGKADPLKGTPFEGLPVDHPVVKWAAQTAERQSWNTQATEFAKALHASGVPQTMIPELVQFVDQVRGVVARNQELEGLLAKVDKSDMVVSTMAARVAGRYKAYGVEAEDLIRAHPSSAGEMETLAKTIAVHNRRTSVATRASSGADRFESTGHGSPTTDIMDMKKPGLDILRRAFA